jgi:peptidoglycan hydrolase-like protein with peptidoglycan-binding domain
VNGTPAILLYGSTPAWRALSEGLSGPDVAELNADLVALGYTTSAELSPSDYFGSATLQAVEAFQTHLGVPATGTLTLGQVAFLPTPVRVTQVPAILGAPAANGVPVLQGTSTTRKVTATLDATQVSEVHAGDQASITLPDHRTTPGTIASIGHVATAPSSSGDGGNGNAPSGPSTVQVTVTATDPAATGVEDQDPVTVAVTTATVRSVLAVPVTALVTMADGHPGLRVVGGGRFTQTVPVSIGLSDDADGLVEVYGPTLAAGQHVLLPPTERPTS